MSFYCVGSGIELWLSDLVVSAFNPLTDLSILKFKIPDNQCVLKAPQTLKPRSKNDLTPTTFSDLGPILVKKQGMGKILY